ncbi:homeobox-leucine zipper protein HDG11-like, partial [Cornus florida]|uniref:homeobox-leucine zipper protein HDG11-like n=1 Tax=Cornus florida TaxID=4283 RepID=UPI002897EF0E
RFFKECPHPDEKQRWQLSRELGLESRQVKFWFQNKRTQTKTQHERADNYTLRTENEKIQCENLAIREALKTVTCHDCGGQPFRNEEQQHNIERLHIENARLKQEHERVSILVSKFLGKPVTQVLPPSPALRSSMDFPVESYPGHGMAVYSFNLVSGNLNNPTLPYQLNLNGIQEIEKSLVIGTAVSAMDELIKLLRVNEPVWYKSPSSERYVLHRHSYDKLSSRVNHFKNSSARIESSKYSGVVMMPGMRLVDMFLDSVNSDTLLHNIRVWLTCVYIYIYIYIYIYMYLYACICVTVRVCWCWEEKITKRRRKQMVKGTRL